MKAQVLPAITARVISTKAMAMDLVIRSSSVPSGGSRSDSMPAAFALQVPFLDQVDDRGRRRHQQRGVAEQHQRDVHHQPGVANRRAAPGADRRPQAAHQRQHEHQREEEDAHGLDAVAPVDEQEEQGDQEARTRRPTRRSCAAGSFRSAPSPRRWRPCAAPRPPTTPTTPAGKPARAAAAPSGWRAAGRANTEPTATRNQMALISSMTGGVFPER